MQTSEISIMTTHTKRKSEKPRLMRQRADWMVPVDDSILEYVRDAGEVPPAVIGRNIDGHPNYVGQRCRKLASNGLLNRMDDGYYSLTELGRQYLDEELDPGDLEDNSSE